MYQASVQALEYAEQFAGILHVETGTIVTHREFARAVGQFAHGNLDDRRVAAGGVLDRVAQQVQPQLSHHVLVGHQHRQRRDLPFDLARRAVAGVVAQVGVQHRAGFLHQRLHIDRLQAHRTAPQPRIHQQVVDQQRHAPRRIADDLQVMPGLLVRAFAQVAVELVGEAGDMAQRRAQVVRDRIAERLQLAVDLGHLLDLALKLPVQFLHPQLHRALQGDVADRHQHHFVIAVGQRHAPGVDQHDADALVAAALLVLVIPQLAPAQQHVGQPLEDDRIGPDAATDLGQRPPVQRRRTLTIQFGEGRVVQHHLLRAIEQRDGLSHGLQHRPGARAFPQQALLGAGAAAYLPPQQPHHQRQQQQLRHQRGPRHQRRLPLLPFGLGHALGQHGLLVPLQFPDDAADRVVEGHLLDQLPLLLRVAGGAAGDLLGQRYAPLQQRIHATHAQQLFLVVAHQPRQLIDVGVDLVGLVHALAQRRSVDALGQRQRRRFDVTDVGLQVVQPRAHLVGMRHPLRGIDRFAGQLALQYGGHHDDQDRGQRQTGESPTLVQVVGEA